MRERPILFGAPMVRALRADTKTQTRRAVKIAPEAKFMGIGTDGAFNFMIDSTDKLQAFFIRCPYGVIGDRLWARETFSGPRHQEHHPPRDWHTTDPIHYWADGSSTRQAKWSLSRKDHRKQQTLFPWVLLQR